MAHREKHMKIFLVSRRYLYDLARDLKVICFIDWKLHHDEPDWFDWQYHHISNQKVLMKSLTDAGSTCGCFFDPLQIFPNDTCLCTLIFCLLYTNARVTLLNLKLVNVILLSNELDILFGKWIKSFLAHRFRKRFNVECYYWLHFSIWPFLTSFPRRNLIITPPARVYILFLSFYHNSLNNK